MFFMSVPYCFATETIPLIIWKDEPKDSTPVQTNRVGISLTVSATINDTELAVYWNYTLTISYGSNTLRGEFLME